jgi:hypothetical protein
MDYIDVFDTLPLFAVLAQWNRCLFVISTHNRSLRGRPEENMAISPGVFTTHRPSRAAALVPGIYGWRSCDCLIIASHSPTIHGCSLTMFAAP